MIINLFQRATRHFKALCVVTICSIMGFAAKAQDGQWTHYFTPPGVYAMAVDTQNRPWFGTNEGVWTWTGSNYTYSNTENSPLLSNHIRAVYIDAQGNKWLGTDAGLHKWNGTNWSSFSLSNVGMNREVSKIMPDNQGNLWLACGSNLVQFNIQTTLFQLYTPQIPSNPFTYSILALAIDAQGNKWLSLGEYGIAKFDGANWTIYDTTNSGLVGSYISSIAIDAQNNKWIGSEIGISKFDGSTWTTYNTTNSGIAGNVINCITVDPQGNKWFGTREGASKLSGTTWTNYNATNSLLPANMPIRSITIDAQGNKWFTTNTSVFQWNGTIWTALPTMANSGLSSNTIYSVAADSQNNKWFGTLNGVTKFDGSTWTNNDTLGHVIGIVVDAQNNKWFATAHEGLWKWNGTTLTHYTPPNPLGSLYLTAIAIDAQGNKWIGSGQNGVFRFDGSTWTPYNTANSGLISDRIESIAVDAQGNKWFGTWSSGVSKLNGSTWTHYDNLNSDIQMDQVKTILVDAQGHKWFGGGVFGGGSSLARWNDTTWTVYNQNNSPLQGWFLNSIAVERNGTLWLASDKGVQSLDGPNWTTFNSSTIQWTDYDMNCVAIDRNDKKWFGTAQKGVRSLNARCFVRGTTQNLSIPQGRQVVVNGHTYTITGTYLDTFARPNLCDSIVTTVLTVIPCTLRVRFLNENRPNSVPFNNRLQAVVTGGLPPYRYAWSSGSTTAYDTLLWSPVGPPFMIHNVSVTDSNGCVATIGGLFEPNRFSLDTLLVPCGNRIAICVPIRFSRTSNVTPTSYTLFFKFDSTLIRPNTVLNHRLGNVMTGSQVTQTINQDTLQLNLSGGNGRVGNRGDTLICLSWLSVAPSANGHSRSFISGFIAGFDPQQPPQFYELYAPADRASNIGFSLQLMKGDSAKPMLYSVLSNPTTFATGTRGNMQRRGSFDANGKYLFTNAFLNGIQIQRKSLAVEGLPELDGTDAFEMNLVVTDHPNTTRSVPQLLAMDVNGDMKIDTADIAAVIERSLNPQTGFKQSNGDTIAWRHLAKTDLATRAAYRLSATFPNNDGIGISRHRLPSIDTLMGVDSTFRNRCDTPSLNVIGVFLGDADGSYFDAGTDSKGALADTTIFFDGRNAIPIGRDTFKVPIYANQRMFGIGIKIENYTNPIQVLSVSNGGEVKSFGRVHAPTKRYFMTAYSTNGNGIAANTPLCYVTVKTNCPFPSQFGTMTAYLNGKKANTQVTWNLCTPTGETNLETAISLYPNPATELLTIDYSPSVQQLSLINLLGQSLKVLEINASGRMEVDVSELPQGVYFLRVNEKILKKFVKM
jgi:ligand-binding sensor domain-containing protein